MRSHKRFALLLCVAMFVSAVCGVSPLAIEVKQYLATTNSSIFRVQLPYVSIEVGTPPQSLEVYLDINHGDVVVANQTSATCDAGPGAGISCNGGTYHQNASTTAESQSSISLVDNAYNGGSVIKDTVRIGDVSFPNMVVVVISGSSPAFGIGGRSNQEQTSSSYVNIPMSLNQTGATNIVGYSFYLQHTNSTASGRLVFGGVETAKFNGQLEPLQMLQSTGSASSGNIAVILSNISLSTASTSTAISAVDNIQVVIGPSYPGMALPPSVTDQIVSVLNLTEALSLSQAQFREPGIILPHDAIQNETTIDLQFGAATIQVPVWDMLLPYNATHSFMYLVNSTDIPSGQPYIGADFFRNAYCVFDFTHNQLSIAPLDHNALSSDNITPISSTGAAGLTGSGSQDQSSSDSSSNSGLSPGAKAGIGVGVSVGVLLLAGVAAFFFWRRYKSRKVQAKRRSGPRTELPTEFHTPEKEKVTHRPPPGGPQYTLVELEGNEGSSLAVTHGSAAESRSAITHEMASN